MSKTQKQQETAMNKQTKYKLQGPCAYLFISGNTGSWRLERPVVDFSLCIACGICAMYCPTNVISVDKEKNKQKEKCITVLWDYCKGCGICANECPKHCIEMVDERSIKQ